MGEKVWFAFPLVALLSQLGGTYKKQFRRFGIPSIICIVAFLSFGWSWWLLLAWLCVFSATTLPFTLIGDGVDDSWFNYVWMLLWAFIISFSTFSFAIETGLWKLFLLGHIVSVPLIFSCALFSNIDSTSKFFPWKFCEALMWGMAMYPALLILQ